MAFPFFLALKYLRPKRSFISVVTVISILGVIFGVAIIIIVRSVMTGFGDMWREKILAFKPHITVSAWEGLVTNEERLCQIIEAVPGVTAVSPSVEMRVLVDHKRHISAPVFVGIHPDRVTGMLQITNMVDGIFDLTGDAALLGLDLAAELEVSVGDEILVYSPMNLVTPDEVYFPEKLIVKGIFNSGQRDFDSGFLITSLAVGRDLMGLRQGAYSIHVKTSEPQNMPAFTRCVEAVRDAIGPKYRVRTWQEIDRQLFNALAVEKNMMVILLMFITVVAIFCVTVTLIVITVQKTNEIGLLKALGFSWQQITLTFMIHGWIQCIIGTILGIGAALLILNNMQALVNLLGKFGLEVFPKSIYGLEEIPWRLIPAEIVQVVISVLVFCSVASIVPALLAALKDPVVALRRE